MRRKLVRVVALLTSLLILTSCGAGKGEPGQTVAAEDIPEIGLCLDSLVVERWEKDRDIFISAATECGAVVNIQNANGDSKKQEEQIEYLIDKNVDIIVIVAVDSDNLSEEVDKAHKKGIKVIAYDRLIKNANVDLYISFDNIEVGSLMAQSLYAGLGDGANIVMVNGPTTDNNVSEIEQGFNEYNNGRMNIVDVTYIDGWKQELAYDYVADNIDMFEDVDGVMCGNDAIAGQVIKALSTYRIKDDVMVVGQDAELEACQRIAGGFQDMTVYKPINELAASAAGYAYDMACNKPIEYVGKKYDGTYYVPYISVGSEAVTADNMDELIIGSGFHLESDVYMYR